MNDEKGPYSGSRWEPEPGSTGQEAGPAEAGPTRRWFSLRGRGALVAVATAVVALSGVGGYALGSVTADDGGRLGPVGDHVPAEGRLPGPPPGLGDGGVGPHDHDLDGDLDEDPAT